MTNPILPLSEGELEFIKTLYPENNPYFEFEKRLRELFVEQTEVLKQTIQNMKAVGQVKEAIIVNAILLDMTIRFAPLMTSDSEGSRTKEEKKR
jgi:hypothetical protein